MLYVIGGLLDVYSTKMIYDEKNDYLFIVYISISHKQATINYKEPDVHPKFYTGVIVVEHPISKAKCNRFDDISISKDQPW